ncbi:AtpZ/AtpI family protein [Arenibacter sp. 6A1]|uniref:AtpZ/AtpI family protein n=1 Tax=Arenibacter sp. 6A1 TaxID=2720391 RepID=UPI001448A2D5|nr:AtpZ/AtpI family protein [Arenibacter sp. 6A1]NKI26816.1 AtpZ/AtpI family protein [Arenibacter sp. 6A1]
MKKKKSPDSSSKISKFIQFTGLSFQIGITIYLGNWLGTWLDEKYQTDNQLYTNICTLAAIFLAMGSAIVQVIRISKKEE